MLINYYNLEFLKLAINSLHTIYWLLKFLYFIFNRFIFMEELLALQ